MSDFTFRRLSPIILSLLALISACTSNSSISEPDSPKQGEVNSANSVLRLGFISTSKVSALTGPIGWAVKRGKFLPELRSLGITEVQNVSFPNGPDLNEALVAGKIDIGIYGDTPAIVAKANGTPTRLISQDQVGLNSWLLAKKNGPHSVIDLKGKKVATAKGSYMYRYLVGLLQKYGINHQVTVVHLLTSEAKAALEKGDVDAIAASIGNGPLLKAQGYPVLDEAIAHPDLLGTNVTVITETYLAQHPDLPKRWNELKEASVRDMKANSAAYYKFHADVSGYPLAIIKASYPLDEFSEEAIPAKGVQLLESTKRFLVTEHLAKSDFKLSDWIFPESKNNK
jgi:NitT/TauT family transport system substrate-binding protein/sulfonate transport system substrate-binding protein